MSAHHHLKHQRGYATTAIDASGWVEGITALTEEAPATKLLAEQEAAIANGASAHLRERSAEGGLAVELTPEQEFEASLEHALGLMEAEVGWWCGTWVSRIHTSDSERCSVRSTVLVWHLGSFFGRVEMQLWAV